MSRKAVLSLLCIVMVLALAASYLFMQRRSAQDDGFAMIQIGEASLRVELAQTPDDISRGLSDRDSIGSDGMLFVLATRSIPSFWMYHMRFALDFVWIDGDHIVDITSHVLPPSPSTKSSALEIYKPKVAVTHILELTAGSVEKYGFVIGDAVTIRPLGIR